MWTEQQVRTSLHKHFSRRVVCMPCLAVSSGGVLLGRVTAGQKDLGVLVRRAVSVVV